MMELFRDNRERLLTVKYVRKKRLLAVIYCWKSLHLICLRSYDYVYARRLQAHTSLSHKKGGFKDLHSIS